jgi:hypothetical protein
MQEMLLNWIEMALDMPKLVRLGYCLPKPETRAKPEATTTNSTTAILENTADKAM